MLFITNITSRRFTKNWVDSIQCNFALKITGAVRGSSSIFYQEIGLESLQNRCCFWELCQFHKLLKSKSSRYIFNIIQTKLIAHSTRYCDNIPLNKIKSNYFSILFFEVECNKINWEVRKSENIRIFKNEFWSLRDLKLIVFSIFITHMT